MTIEIHQPELEALIRQRMASGHFQSVEDLLWQSLERSSGGQAHPLPQESLEEMFARARGLFQDEELDFRRDPSPGRSVELS